MVKIIHNKREHTAALARAYELMQMDLKKESALGDEFEMLVLFIQDYERTHFPVPPPDPIEAIKFRADQMGLSETALSRILGSRQRRHEIMTGKRKLSLGMIRTLHKELRIPAETLIQEYTVRKSPRRRSVAAAKPRAKKRA